MSWTHTIDRHDQTDVVIGHLRECKNKSDVLIGYRLDLKNLSSDWYNLIHAL